MKIDFMLRPQSKSLQISKDYDHTWCCGLNEVCPPRVDVLEAWSHCGSVGIGETYGR
jgi:hypothetical protein